MVKIKAFTVTKNEYDLIETWIIYYLNLFGENNVVVIDSGSTNQVVFDIYDKYKNVIELVKWPGYAGTNQGDAVTHEMLKYKDSYDYLFAADTDEFLVKECAEGFTPKVDDILQVFETIRPEFSIFYIKHHFHSCSMGVDRVKYPLLEITHFCDNMHTNNYNGVACKYNKSFYRAKHFKKTVNGCHDGIVDQGQPLHVSLAFSHYHDRGKLRNLEQAEMTCYSYGYCSPDETNDVKLARLRRNRNSNGCHRVDEYIRFLESGKYTFNEVYNYTSSAMVLHAQELYKKYNICIE